MSISTQFVANNIKCINCPNTVLPPFISKVPVCNACISKELRGEIELPGDDSIEGDDYYVKHLICRQCRKIKLPSNWPSNLEPTCTMCISKSIMTNYRKE